MITEQVLSRLEDIADHVDLLTVLDSEGGVEYADFLTTREVWDYYKEREYEAEVTGTNIKIYYDKMMLGYVIELG